MTSLFRAIALCSLLGTALPAARAADPATLLRQSLKASGGAKAWQAVASLHWRYALKQSGQEGWEDDWADLRTGRHASEAHLAPYLQRSGFDGLTPWTSTPDGLPYAKGDVDSLLGAANAAYRNALAWWFPERHAATLASAGTRREHGRSFDLLTITPAGGRPFTLWLDQKTHLMDRIVEQQAEGVYELRYEDYRWQQGLRLPFTLRTGDGGEPSAVQQVQRIEIDAAIPDARYALPPRTPEQQAQASGPVTVPMRVVNNVPLVDVMIDGQGPYEADFDTGGELMLTPAVTAELQLASGGQWKQTGGGEGIVTASAGTLREIAIGGAKVLRPVFTVHAFDDAAPKRILVGAEFLHRYVVRMDFDAMTLTLTPPEQFDDRGHGAVLPFHFQSNQPEVSGAVDGIAGSFAVDTGDNGALLLIAEFARRHRLVQRYHAEIPYGGMAITATRGLYARAHAVTLNGADGRPVVQVLRPKTRISTQQGGFDANRYVSANLGLGLLKQFNLTFDYPRQRIIFEPSHFNGVPEYFNGAGLRLHREGAAWRVSGLYAHSPAERAGIRDGDELLQMGGLPAAELDGAKAGALLRQTPGTLLDLTLRRGSETLQRQLRLEELLPDVLGAGG